MAVEFPLREPFCMNEYKSNSNRVTLYPFIFVVVTKITDQVNGTTVIVPFKITEIRLSAPTDLVTCVTQPVIVNTNKQIQFNTVSLDIVLIDPLGSHFQSKIHLSALSL